MNTGKLWGAAVGRRGSCWGAARERLILSGDPFVYLIPNVLSMHTSPEVHEEFLIKIGSQLSQTETPV